MTGRDLRARAVLLLAGLLVGLALAEVLARVVYREPWYMRLVAEQRAHARYEYRRNSLGLRGPELPRAKPATTRRVLVLGDSFTFGHGITDDQAVFPALLERALNARRLPLGVEHVDVLNGAIPGSLPNHWVEVVERVGDVVQPDVILVVFFLRDGTLLSPKRDVFEAIRNDIVTRNRASPWYWNLCLYRVLRDALDRRRITTDYAARLTRAYVGTARETIAWDAAQQNLLRIDELARERGAVVGLAVFPILADLEGPYPFQRICDTVADFGRRAGLRVRDLLPAFRGLQAAELWVSPLDQHPNAQAHAIAARALLPFVEELLAAAEERRGRPAESRSEQSAQRRASELRTSR